MHPAIATRRAKNTQPIIIAAAYLRHLHAVRCARAALLSAPYESYAFVWPESYEAGLRRRTYPQILKSCERADCGCVVPKSALYVDPRNPADTICLLHGNISCCAECGQPTGEAITPDTEARSKARALFFCSDLCRANVAA